MGKGRWIRGMANGEWVKGMDSALSTARAAWLRLRRHQAVCVRGRYGARATSGNSICSLLLHFGSVLEPLRAFLKELTNLRLDC